MTVSELIKVIDGFPNYLYTFFTEDGFHRVILGGHSCRTQDKYTNLDSCERYFDEMQKLYEKESLTNEEKAIIAKKMKRIMNICDYRHSKLHSIKEQGEYPKDCVNL